MIKLTLSIFFLITFFSALRADQIEIRPAGEGKDALVRSITPDMNYGNLQNLLTYTWTHGGIPSVARSFLQFDLGDLPPDVRIDSAFISLYSFPWDNIDLGHHRSVNGHLNASILKYVTAPWDESQITWQNQPTAEGDGIYYPAVAGNDSLYHIDIREWVEYWYTHPDENYGLMHQRQIEEKYRAVVMASGDNPDEKLRPRLMIYYTLPAGVNKPPVISFNYKKIKDACIQSRSAKQNFGSSGTLPVFTRTSDSLPAVSCALLGFEIDLLPKGIVIDSAYLSLSAITDDSTKPARGNNTISLHLVTSSWTDTAVTWSGKPSFTREKFGTSRVKKESLEKIVISVAEAVKRMMEDRQGYHGFLLQSDTEFPDSALTFASTENPQVFLRPKIDIWYHHVITHSAPSLSPSLVLVFPNPSLGAVNIIEAEKYEMVYLNDLSGRLREKFKPASKLDFGMLEKGAYLLSLKEKNGVQHTLKFFKE